jgi:uncharacterized protein YggE
MKLHVLGVLLLVVAVLSGITTLPANNAQAQAQPPAASEPPRSVTVSGAGRVSVQPDVAVVNIGVETTAEEASAALAQNNEQMQALLDTLQSAGVASEDIQTQTVQLYSPNMEPMQPPPAETRGAEQPQSAGYRALNLVEVRVRDLTQVGNLIDQAVQAGGNQIHGIRFELSDPQAALDQARQEAWNEARHKAEQWAELTGAALGEVLTINEYQSAIPYAAESTLVRGAAADVPIEPGAQTVQVDVQVSWRLE